jgi:MoaA/NifB/PqqE/SkfB family radical SAM enzyme
MTTIKARRWSQVVGSIPHYINELRDIRDFRGAHQWLYHKLPYLFSLREYPLVVELEPTNDCNFACPHCPRNEINRNRQIGFMPFTLFTDIVTELAPTKPLMIKLVGLGEPALHPDLGRMMSLLRDNGLATALYTNGTLFERWSHSEILHWNFRFLVVSIDGTDERSFERLRKGGKYFWTRDAVQRFRRARDESATTRPTIEIRHVIMPNETRAELAEFRRDWLKLGDTVKFNYLNPATGTGVPDPGRPRCRDIRRELYIRVDGRVPLCAVHKEWLGDVNNASIFQLWHSARIQEVRHFHQQKDFRQVPFCTTCPFR